MKLKGFRINRLYCIVILLCLLSIAGCKKLVQVDEPDDSLTTATVFSNDSLAQAAVTGLYIKIMGSTRFLLNGGMSLFPALSADELVRSTPNLNEDQFSYNAILSSNQLINVNIWKAAYAYIYQCNICIEGLQRSSAVNAALKKRLTGEVLFARALCYYYLVNLYGDVPLVVGTNAEVNAVLSRAPTGQVYLQMEADLLAAREALSGTTTNTTPTQNAAMALLARVYLHMQYWDKAEEMATAVISSGQFKLTADLNTVFKKSSQEIIFQWAPVVDKTNAPEGLIFLPATIHTRPNYILTKELLTAFETGDLRKENWTKPAKSGVDTFYYPFKFKIFLSNDGATEYNVVLRLAEQYLIRAEARARQMRIEEAVEDINVVRSRAGLPAIAKNVTTEECLQKIEQERRIELFAEWGHRWFDLKRTHRADAVFSLVKGNYWQATDQLYPIPSTEIETATNLRQNPGYD